MAIMHLVSYVSSIKSKHVDYCFDFQTSIVLIWRRRISMKENDIQSERFQRYRFAITNRRNLFSKIIFF